MNLERIEQDFRIKVSEKLRVKSEGIERFRVFVPFMFEDGDHLSIVMRKGDDQWILTDEGHTYMHLTYDLEEKSSTGDKAKNHHKRVIRIQSRGSRGRTHN